ncbi:restriction endonuclease subunit S [Helicobacter pylori]|uniref:restriction endonuclease subunit S n=1 Tax=Helicobacter pylori TaxID=210 RepID=UPI000EAFC62E|nr:restriction endonuclease subunit S [Helicobacter pylori]
MHKIERLLQTLAPKGVEFRKLGDIGEYIRGVTYKKNQEINNLECGIKVLRANNITLSNHLNFEDIKVINKNVKIRKEQYLKKNDILICAGSGSSEHIGKVAFINTDFDYVFGGFMGVIRIREVNSRFVYHIFTSNIFKQYLEKSLNTTTINNLNANILQNFLIPIPPLEIQQEIVKILDAFTELNTELKARKKQYEYYQNMLLDFNDINQNHKDAKMSAKTYPKRLKTLLQTLAPKGVEFRKLGEVCESTNKKTLKISEVSEVKNKGMYPVINSGRDLYGYYHDFNNDGENITIASRGEYAGFINYFNEKFFAGGLCYPYKVKDTNELLTKFLYFYLKTNEIQIMENLVFRGSIPALNKADIETLTIPIPPLEIQQEIVKILDQFSILTTDLLAGIPAEIKARKKQYEYYREKLLTFKPLTPLNNKELA